MRESSDAPAIVRSASLAVALLAVLALLPATLLAAPAGAQPVAATAQPAAPAAQPQEGDVTVERIAGGNRFETAAELALATFEDADAAVLATGEDFPDALAASYAAGRIAGPILLATQEEVPQVTLDVLADLGVATVVLVGGTAALGDAVEAQLQEAGHVTERIAGADRYETAAAVAQRYGPDGGVGELDGERTAILASGVTFADALSAGPIAAAANLPLLLTPAQSPAGVVDEALLELDIARLLVVGGAGAVGEAVAAHHADRGYSVERLAGPTRTETAVAVAQAAVGRFPMLSASTVLLARGDDFPDALAASAHGAFSGAALLLTASPTDLSPGTRDHLAALCPDVAVIRAIGGGAAVGADVLDAAVEAAEACTVEGPVEVSSFTTPLEPGQPRNTNIHLAADYIDGSVIAAGEGFSLNAAIGPRTAERGFVPNGFIDEEGDVVSVVGGGVSQMATTFLNAAWFAGIRIDEFRQHTIYFERYPMCREATLTWGQLDVLVVNDSPSDITVSTSYTDSSVTVTFLSQPWASVDSWIGPPTDVTGPGGAFSTTCGRTITYPDGTTSEESYSWRYTSGFPG